MMRTRRLLFRAPWALLALGATALSAQEPLTSQKPNPKPDPVFPFSTEIEDFARADSKGPALKDATLFLGSSSIRLWDIRNSFPDMVTVNRGFGGATTPDVLHYYPRLRPKSAPKSIVVYVGDNDLAAGATPEKVLNDNLTLLGKLRSDYPKARILWMSMKPSPIRWTLYPKMVAINTAVSEQARKGGFDYLEVGKALLAPDGLPDASLFRQDGLHLNARGYALWNRLVSIWLNGVTLPKMPLPNVAIGPTTKPR